MSDLDDDETPAPGPHSHEGNKALLKVLGNYVLEAREHTIRLEHLYDGLRLMDEQAPKSWGEKVLEEFERHHQANASNLEELRLVVKNA